MKYFLTIVSVFSCVFTISAQNIQYTQQNEILFSQVGIDPKVLKSKYDAVDGSPYLFKDWVNSTLIDKSGKVLKDAPIMYDQVDGTFLFKRKNGQIYTFSKDVVKVEMKDPTTLSLIIYESGFPQGKDTSPQTFFQVFNQGKIQLLAEVKKSIEESRNYLGVTNKSIQKITKYYLSFDHNPPVEVKLDNKSILSVLNMPKAESLVKDKRYNLKKIDDIMALLKDLNG